MRSLAAAVLVLLAAAAVVYLAWRAARPRPAPPAPKAVAVVREVAARFGCGPGRVTAEDTRDAAGPLALVTVHAPRRFPVERFVLDLEAAAHNLGGRLDPMPLLEKGGYGLARLEGEVAGARWRVLVLGEEPPEAPRRSSEVGGAGGRGARASRSCSTTPAPRSRWCGRSSACPSRWPSRCCRTPPARPRSPAGSARRGARCCSTCRWSRSATTGPGPGEGAVEVGLGAAEIRSRVERALAVVAGARGVNNHMGSRATADAGAMRAVMDVLRPLGLYFLDSRTTADTVAEETARASGVPALRRDVFLDVVSEPEAIRRALDQAAARARAVGSAVAIGHVHPLTIEVLETGVAAHRRRGPPRAAFAAVATRRTSPRRSRWPCVTAQSGRSEASAEQ